MRENSQLTKAKNVLDALSRSVTRNGDTFAYNIRSEVATATIGGNHEAHVYDNIGNSTFAAFNGVSNTYTANNLNQYTSVGRVAPNAPPISPTYDADGNMTAYGPWTYAYDSNSRLVSVSSNGILLVTNFYDAKGRRVKKVTQNGTYVFIYDDWNLIYERVDHAAGGVDEFHYVWGKDLSGTLQGAGGVGGLLYVKINGSIYVPHADAYGNIMRYTDTAGNVVAEYTYDAFGRTVAQTGPLADLFRHRFSTKYFDVETALYYYGYRFYSPGLRRWMNRDPINENGGENLYGFCLNNPLSYYDKNGMFAWKMLSPKVVNDIGAFGETPEYQDFSGWPIKRANPNTWATTGVDWNINVTCSCNGKWWGANSANGSFQPVVHLRSDSMTSKRYNELLALERNHIDDFTQWFEGDGRRMVENFIAKNSNRKFATKTKCEVELTVKLTSDISDGLIIPVVESVQRWDVTGKHNVNF